MSRFAFPLGLIGVSIISISSLVSAVDYPSTTPNGEIPGGTFNQYFSNFLGPAASCLPGQVVSGFSSSGILQCTTSSGYWNSSNGGSSIYFTGTGNVGIGIVNPADKLHIQFNSPSAGIVMTNLANSVGSRGFRVSNDNNRFNIQKTYDDGTFQANLLNILTSGFVGIGTINPQRALDINSDSSWHSMRITRDLETHWTDFIQRSTTYGAPNVFSIYNYNRGNYYHGLSISQDGNVGIGTETPSTRLDIYGNMIVGNSDATYILMKDDESPNGVKYIHANSNNIGFLNGGGSWIARWDNNGNMVNQGRIYTKESNNGGNYGYAMVNPDGRIGRFIVGNGYIETILDGNVYGISVWLSDKKYKTDIRDSGYNALNTIDKLSFKSFYHTVEKRYWKFGLIAQDLESLDNDFVNKMEDGTLNPNITRLVLLGLKGIQEQEVKIKGFQKQIKDIETENEILKEEIKQIKEELRH